MYRCNNCKWKGEEAPLSVYVPQKVCPVCGHNVEEFEETPVVPVVEPEINLDLNRDGKVDKKDSSLAGRALRRIRGRKKRRGRR